MKQLITQFLAFLSAVSVLQAAGLSFDESSKKVELPPNKLKVTVPYTFTNHSQQTVTIRKFDAPCNCLTASITGGTKETGSERVRIAPGESGSIDGHLDLGNFKGTITKKILVWTDADPDSHPSIRLSMEVKVPSLIGAYPQSLSWKRKGEDAPKEFLIKVIDDKPIKILSHKSTSSKINYTVETIKEGFEYKVTVQPTSTHSTVFAALHFHTDSKTPRYKKVQCFVSVKP